MGFFPKMTPEEVRAILGGQEGSKVKLKHVDEDELIDGVYVESSRDEDGGDEYTFIWRYDNSKDRIYMSFVLKKYDKAVMRVRTFVCGKLKAEVIDDVINVQYRSMLGVGGVGCISYGEIKENRPGFPQRIVDEQLRKHEQYDAMLKAHNL